MEQIQRSKEAAHATRALARRARAAADLPRSRAACASAAWAAASAALVIGWCLAASTGLARSGKCDAIDATVVCLAADGDDLLTSDPGDLRALAEADEIHVELVPV